VDIIEDGRNGLLFAPGDFASLAAAMERLLRDPVLRAELGAAARRTVRERFDEEGSAERYRTLFAELAARRGRSRTPR
jgi:glycosyltransferase involved in cell wall biosynthesis